MSQLVDYFACSGHAIEKWIAAFRANDEIRRREVEAQMARHATFRGLRDAEFNILAACQDWDFDLMKAVTAVDLVDAVRAEEGPWVMALRRHAIERISRMDVDDAVLGRWVAWATAINGRPEEGNRQVLSADAAIALKDLCLLALEDQLGLFTCSYW